MTAQAYSSLGLQLVRKPSHLYVFLAGHKQEHQLLAAMVTGVWSGAGGASDPKRQALLRQAWAARAKAGHEVPREWGAYTALILKGYAVVELQRSCRYFP